jgi:hypothetical protein
MIQKNEKVAIGWCDNGLTDGKFTEGLMAAVIAGGANGMPIHTSIRVQGNQIGRQRQVLFDHWADHMKTDWLLWVDSDIVLSLEARSYPSRPSWVWIHLDAQVCHQTDER